MSAKVIEVSLVRLEGYAFQVKKGVRYEVAR